MVSPRSAGISKVNKIDGVWERTQQGSRGMEVIGIDGFSEERRWTQVRSRRRKSEGALRVNGGRVNHEKDLCVWPY